jgi:hypothetical protein
MLSLTAHAILGVVVIWILIVGNRAVFRRTATGPLVSPLEGAYYLVGVVSVLVGWYFNVRFVMQYAHGHTNPIWGDGSWAQFRRAGDRAPQPGPHRAVRWAADRAALSRLDG